MEKFFIHQLNKIRKFFDPYYLTPGENYQNIISLPVSILRSTPASAHEWHSADSVNLPTGTLLEYRGTVKNNHLTGDLNPTQLLFEIKHILPNLNTESRDTVSAVGGDIIAVAPANRRDVSPAVKTVLH